MYANPTTEDLRGLDKKAEQVRSLMVGAEQSKITELWRQLDLSTIYHDWALEGKVLLAEELDIAFNERAITDASILPMVMGIRAHREALDRTREMATRSTFSFSVEILKEFHALYTADPESGKNPQFRREIPLHRSYFHEICPPDEIPPNLKKLLTWMNDPDEAIQVHPLRWATRFHFQFMRTFPFVETSGKIARGLTNLVLIRQGYLPAIVHATERQRYYEAIRQSQDDLLTLLLESELASLDAAEKFLVRTPG